MLAGSFYVAFFTAPVAGAYFIMALALVARWLRRVCFMQYLLEAIVEKKILKLKGPYTRIKMEKNFT